MWSVLLDGAGHSAPKNVRLILAGSSAESLGKEPSSLGGPAMHEVVSISVPFQNREPGGNLA